MGRSGQPFPKSLATSQGPKSLHIFTKWDQSKNTNPGYRNTFASCGKTSNNNHLNYSTHGHVISPLLKTNDYNKTKSTRWQKPFSGSTNQNISHQLLADNNFYVLSPHHWAAHSHIILHLNPFQPGPDSYLSFTAHLSHSQLLWKQGGVIKREEEKKKKCAEGCTGRDSNTNCSHSLAPKGRLQGPASPEKALLSLLWLSAEQLKCP